MIGKDTAMGRIYTTGQLARMLGVAPRTVSKWCDDGKLPSYRIPSPGRPVGKGDRRVLHNELVRFLADNNMPIPSEIGGSDNAPRILCVGPCFANEEALTSSMFPDGAAVRYTVLPFDAGRTAEAWKPHAAVIDMSEGRGVCLAMAGALHSMGCKVRVALACEDDPYPASLTLLGFTAAIAPPHDPAAIKDALASGIKRR